MNNTELSVLIMLVGFFSGSIMYCSIIPKLIAKKDIYEISDDHNLGSANVFKHCGIPLGFTCLLLDMLKGFVPVFVAIRLVNTQSVLFAFVLLAPVFGHALGLFTHLRGGKCIATIFGEMIALLWITPVGLILAILYIFFSVCIKINPNRIRSVLTFAIFAIISIVFEFYFSRYFIGLGCLLCSLVAIAKHTIFAKDEVQNKVSDLVEQTN